MPDASAVCVSPAWAVPLTAGRPAAGDFAPCSLAWTLGRSGPDRADKNRDGAIASRMTIARIMRRTAARKVILQLLVGARGARLSRRETPLDGASHGMKGRRWWVVRPDEISGPFAGGSLSRWPHPPPSRSGFGRILRSRQPERRCAGRGAASSFSIGRCGPADNKLRIP